MKQHQLKLQISKVIDSPEYRFYCPHCDQVTQWETDEDFRIMQALADELFATDCQARAEERAE